MHEANFFDRENNLSISGAVENWLNAARLRLIAVGLGWEEALSRVFRGVGVVPMAEEKCLEVEDS